MINCLFFNVSELSAHSPQLAYLLRRTGLEGMPLLWNLLRGELSMVGPARRSTHEECDYYGMKPGLISPPRDESSDYALNASLIYDLRIAGRGFCHLLQMYNRDSTGG